MQDAHFLLTWQPIRLAPHLAGLYGMTGVSNSVLAGEPNDFEEVTRFLRTGKSNVPYITLTEEGPAYPATEILWDHSTLVKLR